MKGRLVFVFFLFLALIIFFITRKVQGSKIPSDENLQKFIQKNLNCNSFTADSTVYQKGKQSGQTLFKIVGNDWQMTIMDGGIEEASWIKLDNAIYVKDYQDKQWWVTTKQKPQLLSAIDYRTYLQQLTNPNHKNLSTNFLKKELCNNRFCFEYELIDKTIQFPGKNDINHYWWFDDQDYSLKKEEYINGSGDVSDTIYSDCNQTTIDKPINTKSVPQGKDIFMMPGTILIPTSNPDKSPMPPIFPFFIGKK